MGAGLPSGLSDDTPQRPGKNAPPKGGCSIYSVGDFMAFAMKSAFAAFIKSSGT